MERKKWTPKVDVTNNLLKFREKRKWQVALRRYVLERNISANYALYFGLSINQFRQWIELQFSAELNWNNFGSAWQFDHIMPVAYFDFDIEDDRAICWNFINIRVGKIEPAAKDVNSIDIIAAKQYFQLLYEKTNYFVCLKMIEKIDRIASSNINEEPEIERFIIKNREDLEIIATLNKDEFNSLNKDMTLNDILLEREILKKFG